MKHKGVKIITEEVEKDVTFLTDVDPLFVSLVEHGANQQPFRVIKEDAEKGGPGSGHREHDGRPGEGVGGSKPYEGSNAYYRHGGAVGSKDRFAGEVTMRFGIIEGIEKGGPGSGHWGHAGRPGERGGSLPSVGGVEIEPSAGVTPLKEFKKEEVFSKYIVKSEWGNRSEAWIKANRAVGALEARIGHNRVALGKATSAQHKRDLIDYIKALQNQLDKALKKRDRLEGKKVEKSILDEVFKRSKITQEEVDELEDFNIDEYEEEAIEELARKWKVSEEEVRRRLKGKTEKGGEKMSMIIQSILVPKGMTLESLMTKKGLEFLADASQEAEKKFDRYTKYEQMPIEKFDKDSLRLVKIHDDGVWVIGGKPIDQEAAEKGISFGVVSKEMAIRQSVMQAPVTQIQRDPIDVPFGDIFYRELNTFTNIVTGILEQSGRDAASRKADVMSAHDAFGAFLSMSLDSLGEKAEKISRPSEKTDEKVMEGGEDMFRTKEEFVAGVSEVLKEAFASFKEELMKEFQLKRTEETEEEKKKRLEEEEEEKKKISESKDARIEELKAAVESIGKQVKELAEKTDKIGNQLETDPSKTVSEDEGKEQKKVEKSVFSGFFTRRQLRG